MPNIKMPDGQIVAFPDNMPREQINSMIYSRYPDLKPKTENIPNAVRWAVDRMQKDGRTEPSLWESIVVGLSGAGQGAGGVLNKGASGLTLGGSDYVQRKMGINPNETVENIIDSTKSPTMAGLVGLVSGGSEVAGGLPLGAGTFKLAAGLPKYGRLAAGVGTSAGMGGISSAFNSDFDPEETAKGAITGATIDLGLRGAGKGLAKVFSAAERVKGVPRGLANAAADDKGASILDRAVKESKKTAKQVYAQAPEALDTINRRATKQIDDAVRGVDVNEKVSSAKKAYDTFLEQNKGKQVIGGKFTPEEYQKNLQKWFKGSRVVDESGKPLKLYHGTDADFDVFDITKGRQNMDIQGSFFSPYELDAKGYGPNVKEVYLNIKNPADEGTAFSVLKKYQGQNGAGIKAREELQRMGYDGVFNGYDEYIAFDPKQIKSVQNSGAFTNTASLTDKGVKPLPKVSDLGISNKLSNRQKEALEEAWKYGVDNLKQDEAVGSLKHINYMKNRINGMIGEEINKNPKVSKDMLKPLQELKDELSGIIEKANLPAVNKQYAEAMRIRDAFENGKNFNPNKQRVSDFNLKTADERNAFAQGLADKAILNPESKNIAGKITDVRGALRETIGEKANPLFNSIDDLDRTYQNVSNLRNLAGRKLVKSPPMGKSTAGPIREWGDSKLSPVFALADVARKYGTGFAAARAAKYLLNPNLKVGRSWNDAIQPAIPSIATFLANKRNRKGEK